MATQGEVKRLYKSRTDRMIDGVCGGLAEYLRIDPTLIRIAWVFSVFFGGLGVLLYILSMIVMPSRPQTVDAPTTSYRSSPNDKFWGILLLTIGVFLLLGNLGFSVWHLWWGVPWSVALAILLILAGVAFLFGGRNYISSPDKPAAEGSEAPSDTGEAAAAPMQRLFRSRGNRKLLGVCGGMGDYFGIDSTIIRLLFLIGIISSAGIALVLYFLLGLVVPEEPASSNA
jgi:phage shock protein C